MKQKHLKSSSTKGTVYSLDGVLAILLAVVILVATNGYLNRIEFNKINTIAPNEMASDAFNILERTNKINKYYLDNKYFFNNSLLDNLNDNYGTLKNGIKLISNNNLNFRLNFDGIDDYVQLIDSDKLLTDNNDFSIILWFRTTKNSTPMNLITFYRDDYLEYPALQILLRNTTTKEQISVIYNNGLTEYNNNITQDFSDNIYHMVSLSYDDSSNKISIKFDNDNEKTLTTYGTNFESKEAKIGAKDTSHNFFRGDIKQILIFNKTLSNIEITNIFNSNSFFSGDTTELTAQYELQPNNNAINQHIQKLLPSQYNMIIELEDTDNTKITTGIKKEISILNKFISTGERIFTMNDNNTTKILKGRYYVWID